MIIDSHTHIFSKKIIDNVSKKKEMVKALCLETGEARSRIGITALKDECRTSGVDACLMLPTAAAADVERINSDFIRMARENDFLYTAGTLHPDFADSEKELLRLKSEGIRAIKLCSFSQGYNLASLKTHRLFNQIENFNIKKDYPFFVVMDTFFKADIFFKTAPEYNTTPELFGYLIRNFPKINFIGAHMAGLAAPFNEIVRHLPPKKNFYMDTSNASHVLMENQFIELLKKHGPKHILFGTDWPWFGCRREKQRIEFMLDKAGFSNKEKKDVFGGNLLKLMGS